MKKATVFSLLLLCAAIAVPLSSVRDADAQETKSEEWSGQKWEYRVIRIEDRRPDTAGRSGTSRSGGAQEELNKLGDQGWELVSVRIDATAARSNPIFYLKRPKK